MKKAIVLSSGGIDSTTAMAIAKAENYELYSLTLDYGQRHKIEIKSAKKVASSFCVKEHKIIVVDLREIGDSALTANIDIPTDSISMEIPVTYVPARNTIFLSIALAWAEVVGANDIFIGANAVDYSGYPDCRPEYLEAFENLANLGTKAGIKGKKTKIHAPLLRMSKAEIIKKGIALGIDYSITWSCYNPRTGSKACGKCDSCKFRLKGFKEAGYKDPVQYST
ncbi:MAG: 7-cyano-7-deazaguanine synthase QueC [bacterium]|nr:7-cyano-7-deazaguanine synthase QueC [bacterium]